MGVREYTKRATTLGVSLTRRLLNSRESGVALVLLALMLPVITGMVALVVDVGQAYEERREVQTAVDAAALAGAAYLPESPNAAVAAAIEYANRNGVSIQASDVKVYGTYVASDISLCHTPILQDTIEVKAARNVGFGFAKVLGIGSANVSASAKAIVGTAGGGTGVMPWALFMPTNYTYGNEVTLKFAPQSGLGGNFGALAIDGTGASVYRTTIVNGSQRKINVGDRIDIETGDMSGPTRLGVIELIGSDNTTFSEALAVNSDGTMRILKRNCPRLVIVPIITALAKSGGSTQVQIKGFAEAFITSFGGSGINSWVKAKFVKVVDHDAVWSSLGNDYGLRTIRLAR
jgi:hypothetical protein